MSSARSRFVSLFLLVIGLALAILLVSRLDLTRLRQLNRGPEKAPPRERYILDGIEKLDNISKVFAAVAREVKPTVVSIKTERTVKPQDRRSPSPFGQSPFEDLFEHFFRGPSPESDMRTSALGSGVIMSPDGYIITNNHVVEGYDNIKVFLDDERSFDARIVGRDPKTDIAVIKIKARRLPVAETGDSDDVEVGEWVIAVGNSMGFSHTVTAGIISAKGRSLNLAAYESFLQTDAAINPGNSGGALVGLDGKLVGINTAIASQTGANIGIGFAIPVNMVRTVMEDLIDKGRVIRGYLGVYLQDIDEDIADAMRLRNTAGALITSVLSGSPAEAAGLQAGDVILRFNRTKIKDSEQLRFLVADIKPGKKARIQVVRGRRKKTVVVRVGEYPEEETMDPETEEPADREIMGLKVEPVTADLARRYGFSSAGGVVVTEVRTGSSAARAGIRRGDRIREMNRTGINDLNDYTKALEDIDPGDTVLMLLERRGNTFFVGVKIEKD